jgi:hypothetical protein
METESKAAVGSTVSNIFFRHLGNNEVFIYRNAVKINLV